MSIFDTPTAQRQFPGTFSTPRSAAPSRHSNSYPDLPQELQTPSRTYSGSQSFAASDEHRSGPHPPPVTVTQQQQSTAVIPKPDARAGRTDAKSPLELAAKTISDALEAEKRYPPLDDIVGQGHSQSYELPQTQAPEPFTRVALHTIPDAIFEQYNTATSHTLMGLFPELKQAWITVDNRLYLWDYGSQTGFQGFEGQPNTITCVRLLIPKKGVFVGEVNYVLAIATTVDIFLLGIEAKENARGIIDIVIYETKMSVPIRGLDVTLIEGSKTSGRIFFGGKTDNDVYEFTYQAEERWFHGRCGRVCHTSKGVSAFAPRIPYFTTSLSGEHIEQIVIDDTRNLLYTLSSTYTIRAFHMRPDGGLQLTLTHPFAHTLANVRVMVGSNTMVGPKTPIVSISPVSIQHARRTHLIATTSTGCRLYLSAVASDYGYGSPDAAPTSMQVIHIRYPPAGSIVTGNVRRAKIFPPGYFFCFMERGPTNDELFLAAPDTAKILMLAEGGGGTRLQLIEQGMQQPLDSRVEACEIVSGGFSENRSAAGFGNELALQHDVNPCEAAILTNSGVHVMRRRRLVEVFDATLRYGATSTSGVEGEVRKFFETYGRAEGCASALAVACGASFAENIVQGPSRVTDADATELARKFFIEFGGKPRADDNVYDAASLPSLENIKVSGRAEGLALYIARIVRSIWKASIITETRAPTGAVNYANAVPIPKLKSVQDQLIRLSTFLRDNRSFIVGLSGAESLLVAGSKFEEVANQAEHRHLHGLVTLIDSMVEGISFVLFLFDDKLDEIVLSLPDQHRTELKTLDYGNLFANSKGHSLAKDLVNAIVNRNIAAGLNVDAIADALRRRCGSFCSADDVVVYKAVEQVRRAKSEPDSDTKSRYLRESLRLFEETAATLTIDNLRETIQDYREVNYFQGAVRLALRVAREADRGNLALQYLDEPPTNLDTEAAQTYQKRIECYNLAFGVLEQLNQTYGRSYEMVDGMPSAGARVRNETYHIIYNSDDELFHYNLYDWLFTQGQADTLLEVESPFVLGYLHHRGQEHTAHCDLLWQYHARRDNYYEAAEVLHQLAQSDFDLPLEKRLEYFSQASGFCRSYSALGARKKMNELAQQIQEQMDVAVIQDDLLRRIREDTRIHPEKKAKLEKELGRQLRNISELYNGYAEPYGYMEVCLSVFKAADFRGSNEIHLAWQQLISQEHEKAVHNEQAGLPFELVAATVISLGRRFSTSESVFPPSDIIPLLEQYAYEHQRDVGPPGWVVGTLVDAGISEETIFRVLEEMFWRDELPFTGAARKRLLADAVTVAQKWWAKVVRRGEDEGFRPDVIIQALKNMVGVVQRAQEESQRVEFLAADIARRIPV